MLSGILIGNIKIIKNVYTSVVDLVSGIIGADACVVVDLSDAVYTMSFLLTQYFPAMQDSMPPLWTLPLHFQTTIFQ
jgi:hypothetical protein